MLRPNTLPANSSTSLPHLRGKVVEAVKRSTIRLDKSEENIAGVLIPSLTVREFEDNDSAMGQIGLERGGHSIQICRDKFKSILSMMIDIASLQVPLALNLGLVRDPRREDQSDQPESQCFGAHRHPPILRHLQVH